MIEADRIEIRLLNEADIPAAMRLKDLANWNQTTADWLRLLLLEPEGCFAAVAEGKVVGTTTTTTYGRTLAWIGMVLVDPAFRRMGIATRLLNHGLEFLASHVDTVKLDATPDGQPVYERLGFKVESLIERWACDLPRNESQSRHAEMTPEAQQEVFELDRNTFGADRSQLLQKLIDDSIIDPSVVRCSDGKVVAYAMARAGSRASYCGPVVASKPSVAAEVLDSMLARLKRGRVYVDWNTISIADSSVLVERGFSKERDLVRMSYGKHSVVTAPTVFAIAGPEVG